MSQLDTIAQRIQADFEARNDARDGALRRSRELIRTCATAIRASHRDEWDTAHDLLAEASETAAKLQKDLAPYPDLMFAGYTQFLQRFEHTLNKEAVGGNAHSILKGETSCLIDSTV